MSWLLLILTNTCPLGIGIAPLPRVRIVEISLPPTPLPPINHHNLALSYAIGFFKYFLYFAHHQVVNFINTASGIVTLKPLTCFQTDYTRCSINKIDLLMMSTCFLETCRVLK